jgi:hypothetical protein
VTATLIDVVGIIANSLSLSYFIKRRRDGLTEKLFMTLNSFDLLVCVANFSAVISLQIYLDDNGLKAAEKSYLISSILYNVAFDSTGFLTCLISVTRAIKIYRPFFSIKGVWAAASFLLFFLCLITKVVISKFLVIEDPIEVRKYYSGLSSLITLSIVIAVVLSSILTAYWLLCKSEFKRKISKNNRHATITVLILSAIFFMMNAIFVSAAIISFCIRIKIIEECTSIRAFRDIAFSLSQSLNSTINPMIYLTRKKEMRQFVVEIWRKAKDFVSGFGAETENNVLQLTMRRLDDSSNGI